MCNQTREYDSDDLTPHGWSSCETMDFTCKSCGHELRLEIDYDFEFFEALLIDDEDPSYYEDILRYTIPEAKEQYEKEHRTPIRRFSLPSASRFSLPTGGFSLGNRKSRGEPLLKSNFKRGEK